MHLHGFAEVNECICAAQCPHFCYQRHASNCAEPRAILIQNAAHDPGLVCPIAHTVIAFGKEQSWLRALPLAAADEGTYSPVWRS